MSIDVGMVIGELCYISVPAFYAPFLSLAACATGCWVLLSKNHGAARWRGQAERGGAHNTARPRLAASHSCVELSQGLVQPRSESRHTQQHFLSSFMILAAVRRGRPAAGAAPCWQGHPGQGSLSSRQRGLTFTQSHRLHCL